MQLLVCLFAFLCVLIVYAVDRYLTKRRSKDMTKEKLLKKCKAYIDKGEYDKMQRCLMSHPKLLLQHFNELQAELNLYAGEVEHRSEIITKGGDGV